MLKSLMSNNEEKIKCSLYEWLENNTQWFNSYEINLSQSIFKPLAIVDFRCSGMSNLSITAKIGYCEFGIKRQMDDIISKINMLLGFDALTKYKGI